MPARRTLGVPSTRRTRRDPDNTRKQLRGVVVGSSWEGRAVVCNALAGAAAGSADAAGQDTAWRAGGHGLVLVGGAFPLQSTPPVSADGGRWLLTQLAHGGVHAVLRRTCAGRRTAVTLVVTAALRLAEIDAAGALLGAAWRQIDEEARRARQLPGDRQPLPPR
jgi:hypothetical protein